MEAKDGSMGFDFEGTYTKVVPNELLEYDLGDGRPVRVRSEQQGEVTVQTETFQGEDTNTLEQQRHGWQCMLNNYFASLSILNAPLRTIIKTMEPIIRSGSRSDNTLTRIPAIITPALIMMSLLVKIILAFM